ncbi:CheR family methyltransferase [Propionivibrio sp.]|uniref:CheR family methyltransferase n=1 Tax=Propionivibrio sp. TaxID=2212460 RepID=UPI0025E60115|nr:CheR family methyltransferase [Propionivibrio sp.]MBK7355566.1 hypothetical protein [Propionivibrio sp.]MBK8744790.1 hypothetical protein [Propionivibrio sp.]
MRVGQVGQNDKFADPIMIRAYNDGHKGATAFFRNRPFLDTFFSTLRSRCAGRIKILVHASSVGAEPYSLAQWWLNRVLPRCNEGWDIDIAATDIDSGFLAFSQQASYPHGLLAGMTEEEQSWFEKKEGQIVVPSRARNLVRFLQPMSFVDGDPREVFDAVLVMNALTYVSAADQSSSFDRWVSYARHVLAVTAFHPDSILDDLVRSGFAPCMENHRQIHEAWGDRLVKEPVAPDSADYSWRLPPYDTAISDYAYRYGSVFLRENANAGVL